MKTIAKSRIRKEEKSFDNIKEYNKELQRRILDAGIIIINSYAIRYDKPWEGVKLMYGGQVAHVPDYSSTIVSFIYNEFGIII